MVRTRIYLVTTPPRREHRHPCEIDSASLVGVDIIDDSFPSRFACWLESFVISSFVRYFLHSVVARGDSHVNPMPSINDARLFDHLRHCRRHFMFDSCLCFFFRSRFRHMRHCSCNSFRFRFSRCFRFCFRCRRTLLSFDMRYCCRLAIVGIVGCGVLVFFVCVCLLQFCHHFRDGDRRSLFG